MSHSAHFKWFNGDSTRRLEIHYESPAQLFENLIAEMTQHGFQRGKDDVFWIDSDGDHILLEDSESMQIALNLHPNDGVILLESTAAEDVVVIGETAATSGHRQRAGTRRQRSRSHSRGRSRSCSRRRMSRSREERSRSKSSSSSSSSSTDSSLSHEPFAVFRSNWRAPKFHKSHHNMKNRSRGARKRHALKRFRSVHRRNDSFRPFGPFATRLGWCFDPRMCPCFGPPLDPRLHHEFPPRCGFPPRHGGLPFSQWHR